jgi:hypothetical protein
MAILLFGAYQSLELCTLLRDPKLRPFIVTALMRPVRNDHSHYKCRWRTPQPHPNAPDVVREDILICGNCWQGTVKLFDATEVRVKAPECNKCGARVCGVEWDAAAWLGVKPVVAKNGP